MASGMNLKNLYQNEYSFEETVNENLFKIESFETLSVKSKIVSSNNNSIVAKELYLVDTNEDDLFSDKVNQIACYNANLGWVFYVPKEGSVLFLQDEKKFYFYSDNSWQEMQSSSVQTTDGGTIDLSNYITKSCNLSDILNKATARENLNIYSKDDVYKKDETYRKDEVYSKTEVDAKMSNISISSDGGSIDLSGCLNKNNNLSDLSDATMARNNLNVYSKNDTFNKSKNLLDILDQDEACHNIGTLRDWEIRRIGDYKFSAMKTDHDNWLICNGRAISRTTYAELFVLIGTSFGAGDGKTTFNLPDFRNKTLFGADGNLNSTLSSGLPNIIGEIIPGGIPNLTYPIGVSGVSGCFSKSSVANQDFLKYTSSEKATAISTATFDASVSNAIYGKSTIVQPPAITVNVFILAK